MLLLQVGMLSCTWHVAWSVIGLPMVFLYLHATPATPCACVPMHHLSLPGLLLPTSLSLVPPVSALTLLLHAPPPPAILTACCPMLRPTCRPWRPARAPSCAASTMTSQTTCGRTQRATCPTRPACRCCMVLRSPSRCSRKKGERRVWGSKQRSESLAVACLGCGEDGLATCNLPMGRCMHAGCRTGLGQRPSALLLRLSAKLQWHLHAMINVQCTCFPQV